ncbi:MAG: glycosyltransferase family 4 protein [Promethearchaeota archaeon]
MKLNILMIGEDRKIKGGISSVVNTYFESNLIRNHNINYKSTYYGRKNIIVFLEALCSFIYFLLFKKIDIVHIHSASRGSFYRKSIFVLISSFFKKKIIFHIHSGEFADFYYIKSGFIKKFYIKKILNAADIIILVSHQLKKNLEKIIIRKDKLKVLPNPVRLPHSSKCYNSSFNKKTITILFIGRLQKSKGIYDLIEAAEKLIHHEQNIKFILCGNGEIKNVKKLIQRKRIKQYFIITGGIVNKEKYFRKADIFVLPSYYEGMPISILEAASYCLPIVATKVGGVSEIIKDGLSGFLIEPGDIEELKSKILKLISSTSLRKKMGIIAYDKVKNRFNVNIITKQLARIYQELFVKNIEENFERFI